MARERKFALNELYEMVKELLLIHGYEGFTFSLLAEQMDVSRATIYKYFNNKDELITEFMIHELKGFLAELRNINNYNTFDEQFDFLLEKIFNRKNVNYFIEMGKLVDGKNDQKVKKNQEELGKLHLEMYHLLQNFITLGKKENVFKQDVPDSLILGFIFQAIAIPNHFRVPKPEWDKHLKDVIKYGLLAK